MTVSEMLNNFLVEYGMVLAVPTPSFTDAEILFFLNKAQIDIANEIYQSGDSYALHTSGLVANHTYAAVLATNASMPSNNIALDLTSATRYKYFLSLYLSLTRSAVPVINPAEIVKTENIPKDRAKDFETTAGNQPIYRTPRTYVDGNTLVTLYDAYTTLVSGFMEYVKEPKILSLVTDDANYTTTSELRSDYHNAIVTKAVLFAKDVTEQQEAALRIQNEKTI